MDNAKPAFMPGDALLLIDVQKDFCPGGALPIEHCHEVVPEANRLIAAAVAQGIPVFASRDWHPLGHLSFRERGGPWPAHCLQDSDGARFQADLQLPDSVVLVSKGVRFDQDQNSAFDQTGLAVRLRSDGIKRLWIGGLAEDVCVLATVLDARRAGFAVMVVGTATRPLTLEGGQQARAAMRAAGAVVG